MKSLLIVVFLFLIQTFIFGQKGVWLENQGCKYYYNIDAVDNLSFKWNGKCHNDKINGHGSLKVFKDSNILFEYSGVVTNGLLTGKGKVVHSNGDYAIGIWRNGKLEGDGELFWQGTQTKYIGNFMNGVIEGKGQYTYQDGGTYHGDLKNGLKDGYGEEKWSDGTKYIGYYKNGKIHGSGEYTYRNGDKYIGNNEDGKSHGYGEYIFSNGDKYKGQFINNVFHGQGIVTYYNGDIKDCHFNNGNCDGNCKFIWADGTTYLGECQNNLKHGNGTIIFPSEDRLTISFINDNPIGEGVYITKNGLKRKVLAKGTSYEIISDDNSTAVILSLAALGTVIYGVSKLIDSFTGGISAISTGTDGIYTSSSNTNCYTVKENKHKDLLNTSLLWIKVECGKYKNIKEFVYVTKDQGQTYDKDRFWTRQGITKSGYYGYHSSLSGDSYFFKGEDLEKVIKEECSCRDY